MARFIAFPVRFALYLDLLVLILYLELRITYAKGRFAQIFAPRPKGFSTLGDITVTET